MNKVKFNATKAEVAVISIIADRAVQAAKAAGIDYAKSDAFMDIEACHSNGCKLELAKLAAADDFNFGHDVLGIRRYIDRSTGKLLNHFLPRFAA